MYKRDTLADILILITQKTWHDKCFTWKYSRDVSYGQSLPVRIDDRTFYE